MAFSGRTTSVADASLRPHETSAYLVVTGFQMSRELDFFFYIGSTYTYLAVNRVEEIAAREGVPLHWRPFHVRAIMIEQNNRPFIGKPVKLQYMWRDVERRANRYGIPFKSIPAYPVDPEGLANRVAV